jgi:hypothetical protein
LSTKIAILRQWIYKWLPSGWKLIQTKYSTPPLLVTESVVQMQMRVASKRRYMPLRSGSMHRRLDSQAGTSLVIIAGKFRVFLLNKLAMQTESRKFSGYSPCFQTTTSCSDSALANIETLLSFNIPQSKSSDSVHDTDSRANASLVLGKRIRDALEYGSDILKRRRSTKTVALSKDEENCEGSHKDPEDVLILARTLNEKDVERFLQRTLRLECKALQMAHFCGYLSTSLHLLHAKSMGFGPKKTMTQVCGKCKGWNSADSKLVSNFDERIRPCYHPFNLSTSDVGGTND